VPNGRYQAEQLESFLRLFENYLQQVEKVDLFIDLNKTRHGQIYVFKSKSNISSIDDMQIAISRFESFMNLCQNDSKRAEAILISNGLSSKDASHLISKYTKQYQRLELDIRHEFELASLKIGNGSQQQ